MKKSLYLKYRPSDFGSVVGQKAVKRALCSSVKAGEVAHAYLFAGPRGTGKTTTARLIAKALNCLDLQGGFEPCNKCDLCVEMQSGKLTDLIEIDAASNRGIDEIRDLREKINYLPARGKKKVYIIDEVHMLTKEAFNALLKTLEEPPEHVNFILATTELHKIPETVVSRCQKFDFKRVSEEEIVGRLGFIADMEKIDVEDGVLEMIAGRVSGGMRDSISLFEQLIEDGGIKISSAKELLGLSEDGMVKELFEALGKNDRVSALSVVAAAYGKGLDLEVFCHECLRYCRRELLMAVEKGQESLVQKMMEWSELFTEARRKLDAQIPQLSLEVAVIRATSAEVEMKGEVVKVEKNVVIEKVEEVVVEKNVVVEEKKEVKVEEKLEEVVKEQVEEAEVMETVKACKNLEEVEKRWKEVVSSIKKPSFRMSMKSAKPVSLEENTLTLAFNTNFHKEKLDVSENKKLLEEKLKVSLGKVFRVIGRVKAQSKEEVKEKTDEALGIFGGELVD